MGQAMAWPILDFCSQIKHSTVRGECIERLHPHWRLSLTRRRARTGPCDDTPSPTTDMLATNDAVIPPSFCRPVAFGV